MFVVKLKIRSLKIFLDAEKIYDYFFCRRIRIKIGSSERFFFFFWERQIWLPKIVNLIEN